MSKFDGLAKIHNLRTQKPESSIESETPIQPKEDAPQPTQTKKMGRPKGKRSDPNYEQVTAYIKSETYNQVKIKLLQEGRKRDFSELLEALLSEYLKT